MNEVILNLAKPTPGDPDFLVRWGVLGNVYPAALFDPKTVTVLVVDQHIKKKPYFDFPNLKCVCSATTGHTHLKWAEEAGIPLVTLRGETEFLRSIRSVSEFTMKAILEIARPKGTIGTVLCGKSLGIIGMGRIGKHVSVLAHAFGMKVHGVDKESTQWQWENAFKCDFVSIHASEERDNEHLVSRKWIEKMKPSAWLINTARPSLLDEEALADALREGKLAGAYLDVTDRHWLDVEPYRVIQTGHTAGFTLEDRIRTDEFLLDKAKRFLGYKRRVRVMSQ